jgi:hypothetical protein
VLQRFFYLAINPLILETHILLPCSQEPKIALYWIEINWVHILPPYFFKSGFTTTLQYMFRSSNYFLPCSLSHSFFLSHVCYIPINGMRLYTNILIVITERWKLWSFSVRNSLPFSVAVFRLAPNIFRSTLLFFIQSKSFLHMQNDWKIGRQKTPKGC